MSKAKLIVSQPGQRTRSIEITGRTVSIRRRPDNTICLEGDTNVSKYHAVIEVRNGEYWLTDLGSSNGTSVNSEPLRTERKLLNNDLVCVGGTSTLEVHLPPAQTGDANATVVGVPPERRPPPPKASTSSAGSPGPQVTGPPPSQSPPAARKIMGLPTMVVAGAAAGLVVMVGMLAVLFGIGAIGGSDAKKTAAASNISQSQIELEEPLNNSGSDQPASDASTDDSTDSTSGAAPEENSASPPASGGSAVAARADVTAGLARTLAVQISQKSFYNFDPGFVALINNYIDEYRNAKGYYERASKYREVIDREFINVQGIQPPLIGYVIAMSRSKFVEKNEGGGVWQLPPSVLKDYAVVSSASDINNPESSTRVAAAYIRALLDLFEKENFMYAVACYGMTLDEAGKVRTELENKDPGGQGRYDFWKMKNAGVVKGDQVERVARFFAAGIVCENPRQFDLNEKQISSLY